MSIHWSRKYTTETHDQEHSTPSSNQTLQQFNTISPKLLLILTMSTNINVLSLLTPISLQFKLDVDRIRRGVRNRCKRSSGQHNRGSLRRRSRHRRVVNDLDLNRTVRNTGLGLGRADTPHHVLPPACRAVVPDSISGRPEEVARRKLGRIVSVALSCLKNKKQKHGQVKQKRLFGRVSVLILLTNVWRRVLGSGAHVTIAGG